MGKGTALNSKYQKSKRNTTDDQLHVENEET